MPSVEESASEILVSTQERTDLISTSFNSSKSVGTRGRTTPNRRRRATRPNVILGKLIPPLLVYLGYKGYDLAVVQTASYLRFVQQRPLVARLYQLQFILLLFIVVYNFLKVRFTSHRLEGNREPPLEVQQRRIVFECDSDGSPTICHQCERWRPIKTRHCNDCGICIPGFDHHCPIMDACVAERNMSAFVTFLMAAVLLIGLSILPLIPIQYRSLRTVLKSTWDSNSLHEQWWDRRYSWYGGPVTRWAYGLHLAYRIYSDEIVHHHDTYLLPKVFESNSRWSSLATPHLGPLIIVVAAFFVMLVGIAMILTIFLNTKNGVSSVQVERIRRFRNTHGRRAPSGSEAKYEPKIYLFVPNSTKEEVSASILTLTQREGNGYIVGVEPDEKIFDLGPKNNFERLFRSSWIATLNGTISQRDGVEQTYNMKLLYDLVEKAKKET